MAIASLVSDPGGTAPYNHDYQAVAPATPDTTLPVVDNFAPAEDTSINPTDSVAFDVTDDSDDFHSIMITVFYPDSSTWEVIHTGAQFAPRFGAGSGRVAITNGYRYTVRRQGGWLNTPFKIYPFAVDAAGNQNA